jgi:hypothetical protein
VCPLLMAFPLMACEPSHRRSPQPVLTSQAKAAQELKADIQASTQEYHGIRSQTAVLAAQLAEAEKAVVQKQEEAARQRANLEVFRTHLAAGELKLATVEKAHAEKQQINAEGWRKVKDVNDRTADIKTKTNEILELTRQSEKNAAANKLSGGAGGGPGIAAPRPGVPPGPGTVGVRPAGPSGPRPMGPHVNSSPAPGNAPISAAPRPLGPRPMVPQGPTGPTGAVGSRPHR